MDGSAADSLTPVAPVHHAAAREAEAARQAARPLGDDAVREPARPVGDAAARVAAPAQREDGRIDPRVFRRVLGTFATGITVVTMREGEQTHGITVNAFMSVSLDPPLIAVSIDKRANAHATMLEAERFAVSVLRAEQEGLSNHFAGRPCPPVGDVYTEFGGFPVIAGALAHLVCRTYGVTEAGDHSIFLGEVEALTASAGMPLLYFLGQYAHVRDLALSE